jgi:comEA protein
MKFLSYFQSFGFTRNEIKVILLLSCAFLAGLAIRYYNSSRPASNPPGKEFDYSIPDSIFHSRSQKGVEAPARGMTADDSIRERPSLTRSSNAKAIGLAVNINTATKAELMRLPGIGAVYAERIVAYRNDHGPFTSVDGLAKVDGIGKKRLERLRPFVRVQ